MSKYDFTDMDAEDLDGGVPVVPGWYRCEIADVTENEHQIGNLDITFKVTHGPYKGSKIYDTVVDPANARDDEKARRCLQRVSMYLTRSGAYTKEQLARNAVEVDWSELIGRVVVVEAKLNEWTNPEGEKRSNVKPAFGGIYSLDDEKIPDAERRKLGLAAPAKQKLKEPAAPAQQPTATPAPAPAPSRNGSGNGGKGKQRDLSDL